MSINGVGERIWTLVNELVLDPVAQFWRGLTSADRVVLCVLIAAAAIVGFFTGRRRQAFGAGGRRFFGALGLSGFQNSGEALVARTLRAQFGPPDYHLMNHVTLRLDDGTTQIDHILVSRFGVFVIETKDYSGWLFGDATQRTWTQVLFRQKFKFQNPVFQNYRHVCAVRALLDFLPPAAIKSLVVFTGSAEFMTEIPAGVTTVEHLPEHVRRDTQYVMTRNRLQFCVGRLETARLAISRETDVEHVQNLARRHRKPSHS